MSEPRGPLPERSGPRRLARRMEAPFLRTSRTSRPARPAAKPQAPPPSGAVRGDPSRQPFSFGAPHTFYADAQRRCCGCGRDFVLTARDQKCWSETFGLELDGRASRCPTCRRGWIRLHGLRASLSDAARALAAAPRHAPAAIAYARAAVVAAERFGEGPLDAALAALDALAADPVETLYWTGRCLEAMGRGRRAAAAYLRFVAATRGRRDSGGLRADARARVQSVL